MTMGVGTVVRGKWAKLALIGVAGFTLLVAFRRGKLTFWRMLWLLFQVLVGIGEVWQEKRLRQTLNDRLEASGSLRVVPD
jgi:hypothetical protein